MRTSIQTIFLPKYIVFYLEEWLLYHTALGFDHFFLYDNTGSKGCPLSPFGSDKDRWGNKLISEKINNDLVKEYILKICNKFKVTIIKFPSETHAHNETIEDFIYKFGSYFDYTAFIDIDEYIIINKSDIKTFIKEELEDKNFFGVKIMQNKMQNLLKAKKESNKKVYELYNTINLDTMNWAPKCILNPNFIKKVNNMHDFEYLKNYLDQPSKNIIKFNHYNLNDYQIKLIRSWGRYKDINIPPIEESIEKDFSLYKYKNIFENWNYTDLSEIKVFDP